MQNVIYLDNAATTRMYDEVIEYIDIVNRNTYGNPSSFHRIGIEAERILKEARNIIGHSLSCDKGTVYFTSGGTESNNLAIKGFVEANKRNGNHLITTKIEHPSVLELYKYYSVNGYDVDYIDVNEYGYLKLDELRRKINNNTILISIIHVNNEIGTIQSIKEISSLKNSINKDVVIHVDAVQAFGKIQTLPEKDGIDLMSISSHKIHGPKGVGALYVNKNIKIKPIILGGGQEFKLRSGTENTAGIAGFSRAVEIAASGMKSNFLKIDSLKNLFLENLRASISDEKYRVVSPSGGTPYILNISFTNIKAEVLLHHLDEKGICVSTTSACSSRSKDRSHVLKAIGLKDYEIEGAIRISFSSFNTEEEILKAVEEIKKILPKIEIKRGGRR